MFELILVDPKPEVCEALEQAFAEWSAVTVVCDRFETVARFDCMVSAANSFGLMDGGVDLAITNFFGLQLMDRVQQHIIEHYRGEQPVGSSFIIPTGHPQHPFLAHTPTMRVPMRIWATDNVYNAMWSMLLAVWHHNKAATAQIDIVACPGLGTSTGGVSPELAARQMAQAYRSFLTPPEQISWPYARTRQSAVGLGGNRGLDKAMAKINSAK